MQELTSRARGTSTAILRLEGLRRTFRQGSREIVGCVDVAAQTRPGTGQLDGTRMAMALSRICTELRIQLDTEGDQRRSPGAVPIADEAARVGARGRDGLAQFLGLQCG